MGRVEELLVECVDRAPPERAESLDRACGGDAELRREIRAGPVEG